MNVKASKSPLNEMTTNVVNNINDSMIRAKAISKSIMSRMNETVFIHHARDNRIIIVYMKMHPVTQ